MFLKHSLFLPKMQKIQGRNDKVVWTRSVQVSFGNVQITLMNIVLCHKTVKS